MNEDIHTDEDLDRALLALEGELQARGTEIVRVREENQRLRAWLRAMVDATVKVEAPCGWCIELQGWAVEALTGTPFDGAVVRGDAPREGRGEADEEARRAEVFPGGELELGQASSAEPGPVSLASWTRSPAGELHLPR